MKIKRIRKLRTCLFIFVFLCSIFGFLFVYFNNNNDNNGTSIYSYNIINSRDFFLIHDKFTNEFKAKIQRVRYNVSCENMIELNRDEIERAEAMLEMIKKNKAEHGLNDENYIFDRKMCAAFRKIRRYDDHPVRESEKEFPLAFNMLIYENVEQFERLLRTIYRPHNIYCIHVDNKTSTVFKNAIKSIADCFDNVFITSKLESIVYAGISRLNADLNCMNDLMYENGYLKSIKKKKVEWKYLMNLAGSEFPLRTNYELTRILRLYNGGNDIEVLKHHIEARAFHIWKPMYDNKTKQLELKFTGVRKASPPFNFNIVKGLAYGAFSHAFVNYMLTSEYAKGLLKWIEDTYSPDETFFATLQHNTQFNPPGGYRDDWSQVKRVNTTTRFVIWGGDEFDCYSMYMRGICIPSFRELPLILSRKEFFANKFILNYNPIIYQCTEEWLEQRIKSTYSISLYEYCKHPVVKKYSNYMCK